jgi:hypothetical protein
MEQMEIRIQGQIVIPMKMKRQVVDAVGIGIRQVNQVHRENEEVVRILDTGSDLSQAVIVHQ